MSASQIFQFADELDRFVDKFRAEWDLCYEEVCGALLQKIHELQHEARANRELAKTFDKKKTDYEKTPWVIQFEAEKMEWTRVLPNREGWYWQKGQFDTEPQMLLVKKRGLEFFAFRDAFEERGMPIEWLGGFWSSCPIPKPETGEAKL